MQESTPNVPKPASQEVLGTMQPTLHATRAERPTVLGVCCARDVCLVGECLTCSVPVLFFGGGGEDTSTCPASGQTVVTDVVPFPPPPVLTFNFLSCIGFSNPTARRFFIKCC